VSLDVWDPDRSRNARFFLDDPFLAFHYRFVLPYTSALEAGHADEVYEEVIAPHLDDYMGERFEEICRQWVRLYGRERLPSAALEMGRIWSADYDIDVAATLLNREQVFGECKWWGKPVGLNVLDRLRDTSGRTSYRDGKTEPYYLLFARAGFTPEVRTAGEQDARLLHLEPASLILPP
jgi:hypothetical protein